MDLGLIWGFGRHESVRCMGDHARGKNEVFGRINLLHY